MSMVKWSSVESVDLFSLEAVCADPSCSSGSMSNVDWKRALWGRAIVAETLGYGIPRSICLDGPMGDVKDLQTS